MHVWYSDKLLMNPIRSSIKDPLQSFHLRTLKKIKEKAYEVPRWGNEDVEIRCDLLQQQAENKFQTNETGTRTPKLHILSYSYNQLYTFIQTCRKSQANNNQDKTIFMYLNNKILVVFIGKSNCTVDIHSLNCSFSFK